MVSDNKNVVLANQLVKGRYVLTKEEQNFIYLMISQIKQEDTKFTEYQIHIKDLESAELTQKNYQRYKEFATNLMRKGITIEDDKRILCLMVDADRIDKEINEKFINEVHRVLEKTEYIKYNFNKDEDIILDATRTVVKNETEYIKKSKHILF